MCDNYYAEHKQEGVQGWAFDQVWQPRQSSATEKHSQETSSSENQTNITPSSPPTTQHNTREAYLDLVVERGKGRLALLTGGGREGPVVVGRANLFLQDQVVITERLHHLSAQ